MHVKRVMNRLVKQANRITHKVYKNNTLIICDELTLDFTDNFFIMHFRAEMYDSNCNVIKTIKIPFYPDFDLYTIAQLAALLADNIIDAFDKID